MKEQNSSYKQIVKSTGIFGGVQVVTILLGLVRNKAFALWLGPAGVGLISVYQTIVDLVKSITVMGLDTAGVKDIAENADNEDLQYRKISVFKFWIRLTAILGAFTCLVFCYPISVLAFEDGSHTWAIAFLSVCILFTTLSTGQSVILQGTRNLLYMAKATIWGNLVGLCISLLIYYFYGIKGIVPAFITGAVIIFFFTSYYARKLRIPKIQIEKSVIYKQGLTSLRLGSFIVSVYIMEHLSSMLVKAFLTRESGIESVGMVQPAWTISISYIGLILKAMGADFFPRLCSISHSPTRIRRLVNEQTYIAMIIALPIMVIMLLFSYIILPLLFSSKFIEGVPVLQWHVVGSFFKILSWPIAFILLAKGKGFYFLLTEVVYFLVYLSASYLLFPSFGINSIGIAYLLAYVAYLIVLYVYANKTGRFRWSRQNKIMVFVCFLFFGVSALSVICLSEYRLLAGIVIGILSILISLFLFNKVIRLSELFTNIKGKFFHKR